jgi:hypothetical protein
VEDPGLDRRFEEQAAAAIREMLRVLSGLKSLSVPGGREPATLLGYGWWVRVLRSAEAIRFLHVRGFDHEASPLLRTVLHHTAALDWLRTDPAAVLEAVSWDHGTRRQKLYLKARSREWDLSAIRMGPPPRTPRPDAVDYLDRFEKLADLLGAPNMYVAYMVESAFVHPSGLSSDTYVDEVDGAVVLRITSKEPGVPLRQAAVFAAVATRAFGELVTRQDLVDLADAIGARMGVDAKIA